MANLPAHLPLPLAGFVSRLRAAGFAVDASREFQLRRVLHEQGADYIGKFGELKYALAPYVATTATEQRRFYQLWEDYVAELEERLQAPGAADAKNIGRRNAATYLLLTLAALLLGWFVYNTFFADTPESPKDPLRVALAQEAEVRAGQPLPLRNATLLESPADSARFSWEISDVVNGERLVRFDSVFQLNYRVPEDFYGRTVKVRLAAAPAQDGQDSLLSDSLVLAVLCPQAPFVGTPQLPEGAVLRGEAVSLSLPNKAVEGVDYFWLIEGDTLAGTQVQYTFLTEGQAKVQVLAQRTADPEFCFTLLPPRNVQVGIDLPIIPGIPLQRDEARQLLFANSALYLLPLLFGLFGYFLHRRHWKRRSEEDKEKTDDELAEEYPFHDVGPYVIPYQDQSGQIAVPADFYRIADQLRVREEGLRMVFDGRGTVEATVREGGFPSWRERAVKRPANYLVLLRHTDEFHQQDRLLKRLTDFLTAREAALDVYYHGGDFAWFWNEDFPKGWSPSQLKGRYGEHRLVIMGDGHGLLDAFHRGDPRLLPSKERWLHGWSRRLLLTTEPVVDWSFQEVLLHEHCLLYPITTDGILRGVADLNQVEEYQGGSYPRWKAERLRRDPEPSYRYRTWKTIADHQAYLEDDPELFRWLTALSVVPHPDWSLTIAIGRALGLEVTHDRLLRLSRIPWLAANTPDQDLRLAFVDRLSYADEQLARAAALEQLEIVSSEVANTFAETEWIANQAVQSFALAPREMKHQDKVRDLRRLGLLAPDQLEELNLVAERQFPAQKMRRVPAEDEPTYLDKLLDPPAKPKEILTEREKQLLGLIIVCLLLALPMFLYNNGSDHELQEGQLPAWWQVVENPTDDAHLALEANNRAVLLSEYLGRAKNYTEYNERYLNADQKILQALDSALLYRPGYALADSNQSRYYLNNIAYYLNWLIQDSLKTLPTVLAETDTRLASVRARMDSIYGVASPFALQARHAEGIYSWWRYRQGVASDAEVNSIPYERLKAARNAVSAIDSLSATYFTSLADSMPVHLKYLLAREALGRDCGLVEFGQKRYQGRVVNLGGQPVRGATVSIVGTSSGTFTDVDGLFSVEMPRSIGLLEVSAPGALSVTINLLNPDCSIKPGISLEDIQLDLPAGQNGQTPDQQQTATETVRGRVVDANGYPLAGVTVILQNQELRTTTNARGNFTITLREPTEGMALAFELDGLRREQTYNWLSNNGDIGDFVLATEQLAIYDLNGRVVNGKGVPLSNVNVSVQGTNLRTRTNADGTFNVDVDNATRQYRLVFTQGTASTEKSFAYRQAPAGNMGDVVLEVATPEPEEAAILEQINGLGRFRYAKVARQVGTAEQSAQFAQRMASRLGQRPLTRSILTGDALVAGASSINPLAGNSSNGQFLFLEVTRRIGQVADLVSQLHGQSKALIINGTQFSDNYLLPGPDLVSVGRQAAALGNALRENGFEVRTLQNPGKEEVLQVLREYAKQPYNEGSHLFVYIGGYFGNNQLAVKDNFAGLASGVIPEETLDNAINDLLDIPHLLVVKNFTTAPTTAGEQTTGPGGGKIQLVRSGVSRGTIGLGVRNKPALTFTPQTGGTMVFSVCIDNQGRVTNAKFVQEKSGQFAYESVQEVGKNASRWTFNVQPLVAPSQECGEVSFVFE